MSPHSHKLLTVGFAYWESQTSFLDRSNPQREREIESERERIVGHDLIGR